jgi:hypothetical protein
MYLEEVKELQHSISSILEDSLVGANSYGESDQHFYKSTFSPPAIGIHPAKFGEYKLAIRLNSKSDYNIIKPIISNISKDKLDLRVTGPVVSFSSMFPIIHRKSWDEGCNNRGTIGCLVRKRGNSQLLILSNKHILASSSDAQENDSIIIFREEYNWITRLKRLLFISSGKVEEIAFLKEYIELINNKDNLVDAAIAYVQNSEILEKYSIDKFGIFKGFYEKEVFESREDIYDISLSKRGMKSGLTQGNITAFNLKQKINYPNNQAHSFIDIIEIQSKGFKPFSRPGDSGAVIFDNEGYAVALLFAGSRSGMTYAIPISTVLKSLDIEIVTCSDLQS